MTAYRPSIYALYRLSIHGGGRDVTRDVLVLVAVGGGYTVVQVVKGLDDRRIEFRGTMDAEEILDDFQPDAVRAPNGDITANRGSAYVKSARAVATKPDAGTGLFVSWAFVELLPWLFGALVLALLAPVLRAAERGDPFAVDAGGRLRLVGSLLLVGLPTMGLLHFVLAEWGAGGVSPAVSPEWTVTVTQFLPGALVLVLAEVFRRGTELREPERATV